MRRFSRFILTLAVMALLCAVLALACFAVPAKPGTHEGDALCRSHSGTLVTLDSLSKAPGGRGAKTPVQPMTERELPLLIVVLGFNNIDYQDEFDWSSAIFQGEKSLSAYYTDMSFGKFTFVPAEETSAFEVDGNTNAADAVNDGVVHLRLDLDHEDWTLDYNSVLTEKEMSRSLDLALTAAVLAAEPYVDFAAYDRNGNGAIETNELALGFITAGYEASASNYYSEGRDYYLWAHAWSLEEAVEEVGGNYEVPRPDGVQVSSYIALAEQLDEDDSQSPISTLAHELGHYLGLPDLYNTGKKTGEWKNYKVDSLSLMAGGSWGYDEDDNYSPYSLDVWSRTVLGWCEPAEVTQSGDFTLCGQSYDPENETYSAVKIPTPRETEYYLLENRQNTKWDACLCDEFYGEELKNGIVLWHIDMEQYLASEEENEVNVPLHRPSVMPLFPEGERGAYTFIGQASVIDVFQPFFDKMHWESSFQNLGETLVLPLYGSAGNADSRKDRLLSELEVTFLSDSAAAMDIHVDVPAHVHTMTYVERILNDCTLGGVKAHWMCTLCNEPFADENAQTPLTALELTIAPAEHTWDAGTTVTEPTYTNEGVVCYHCTACKVFRYEPIPQLERPSEPEQDDSNLCPYCHKEHKGFLGFFVKIFHLFLNLFK